MKALEAVADGIAQIRMTTPVRKAVVKGIPPHAVLKPSHASFKLQEQHFALGDRVVMVQDSGSVPLGAKGVVVGLSNRYLETLWDNSFISGTDLGGRSVQLRHASNMLYFLLNL